MSDTPKRLFVADIDTDPMFYRKATPAEVVAWLQANGAEVREFCGWCFQPKQYHKRGTLTHYEPRRELVYRLPDEEQS